MEIISLPTMGFASNCYLVHNGLDAFVIDPSISEKKILSRLSEMGLTLKGILLTHGHFDHVFRAQQLRDETHAPLYIHELDDEMLTDANKNAYRTFTGQNFTVEKADILLHDGDIIPLGDEQIKVLHTPGHTKGSVCYVIGRDIFCGDLVFKDGFGRCDLYGGNEGQMVQSLKMLRDFFAENGTDYILRPGHGDKLTAEYFMKQTDFLNR